MFPERFSNLPAYAFPRLRALLDPHPAGGAVRHMTIGEPKHAFPAWIADILAREIAGFGQYPPNDGTPELRAAISDWLHRRYGVRPDPETQVMALNGTREGLYNACMALVPEEKAGQKPAILMPNPFYQVYMIGAISVQADPVFVPATREGGFLPDYTSLPPDLLNRVAAAYICSPANPQGAVASRAYWAELIGLAEKYDFQVFADECYSEIYRGDPPVGALEVAAELGAHPDRVVVFHSLSKRSNLPGLRSGFVAGGAESIARVKQLRAYSGAPLPLPLQRVAEAVWADEAHVHENRALYREKYVAADEIFGGMNSYQGPEAGFFLWLPVEDGETAALKSWTETGVRVLPGAYLSRDTEQGNPGKGYIRVAMVAPMDELRDGLIALRDCIYG
ncbi:aminotransferase class I/II-fold pyridoxal phosphate-dependent enzyme [Lutimaribacter sp. EGI FJ00015]|uniref:Aminotransferase class I/II-fold pyridoxal phosphate-dependent enzyme n=1 Tax=Lutimaribacter degradans TaxID=2945989 RepID=A0ACC5ZXB6_9RHOB|nr:aminotransferase class I/II-fold pyridoxal phosphate-dependent enzyme [Lutimaribacter sp. EGI FJ00013]MCM2562825.1 aminotransferase class I/II-fold pyridoxal phosphate-dependent enzyme [Lutimaribacter sp. EGI FJ00013]MCO0613982.1 aminotransferase class I/II-fold pyridoxal phosphate-dependent enzyme [Lutimaribacter sp. EGI FJ00015]MCO0636954.1 aminotransferase class I/II-fold pyridoxal phosphate-dependent enzyme [Lutimaribacter sp. EGI FJ00014]